METVRAASFNMRQYLYLVAHYSSRAAFEAGVAYIKAQFEAQYQNKGKPMYTHVTCATDKTNAKFVFNAVKDVVIRTSLQEGGLLSM